MPIHITGKLAKLGQSVPACTLMTLMSFSPAYAFDCKVAATPAEKAICADPAAVAADEKLNKVFAELRASLDEKQSAGLLVSQKTWIHERDSCGENSGIPLAECIKSSIVERIKLLEVTPVSGPGASGKLVPYFHFEKGGIGKTNIAVQAFQFAKASDPAQLAFNAEINKLIKDIPQPSAPDAQNADYDYSVSMTLDYASPKLISAHTITSTFLGGAHPNNQSNTINIDVAKGKLAQFGDLLDKAGAKTIFAECEKQVLAQKKENEGAEADTSPATIKRLRSDISNVSGNLELWTFAASKAEIQYDANVLGARADGVFFCTIPYAQLRPLAKPGFPLP